MIDLKQAQKLIENAQNILIAPTQPLQGDGLGSCLALFFTLKKLGKNVNILINKIPEKFQFLNNSPLFSSEDFVIAIDGSEKEITSIRYEKDKKGLKIYLTLNQGEVSEKDISFSTLSQNPDLLIAFDASISLASYRAPILNIADLTDNHACLTETTSELIHTIDTANNLLDENIATCLLTGLICASQNFRSPQTRPQTFTTAAYLIKKGANHQKITQQLYKQKSVSQIKLLGKILEKLSFDEEKEIYCAPLTEQDFQGCGARPSDLSYAVEELKFNFRYLPNLLILWKSHASPVLIRGLIYSAKPGLVEKVLENYEAVSKGEGALFCVRNSDLASVKEQILKIL